MIQLKPHSVMIKPRSAWKMSQGYPHTRLVNTLPWLEVSGSAKVDTPALVADTWQTWDWLSTLGISNYLVRNISQPKFSILKRAELYGCEFSFELKPTSRLALQTTQTTDAHFALDSSGNLLWYPDSNNDFSSLIGATFSLSNYDLIGSAPATLSRVDDNVYVDPVYFYRVPCPSIEGFGVQLQEKHITQQFDSWRTRRIAKAIGDIYAVEAQIALTYEQALQWLNYYINDLPDFIVADWLDSYFGAVKKLYFAADPWELSVDGKKFTLKIDGVVVDG